MGSEESEWKSHKDHLVEEGILQEDFADTMSKRITPELLDKYLSNPTRTLTKGLDYQNGFKKFLYDLNLDEVHPVKLLINPDGYYSNELRLVKLDFTIDSVITSSDGDKYVTNIGIKSTNLDEIHKYLSSYYGIPDSSLIIKNIQEKDSLKVSIWDKGNYQLKCINDTKREGNNKYYHTIADCSYQISSYQEELRKVKNEIRKNLTPDDLLKIVTSGPFFKIEGRFGYEFNVRNVIRNGIEEPRGIKSVRFKILVINKFNEKVFELDNKVLDFYPPLDKNNWNMDSYYFDKYGWDSDYRVSFTLVEGEKAEKLKYEFAGAKVKTEIEKVLFEDGYVFSAGESLVW
jgi:hypothetical protein